MRKRRMSGSLDRLPQVRQRLRDLLARATADAHTAQVERASQLAALHRVMAVIEYDLEGRVLTANQNFLDLFGCCLEDIRGVHHGLFCPPGIADQESFRDLWERLRRGEYETGEYRRIAVDGRELWVQASYNPIFDALGQPYKVIAFVSDISFHREMESALLEAKERAEHAAEVKSAFLANMSHEIRTPMNAIIGFTELLLDTPLNDTQLHHLQTVQHSSRSLLALLNAILDTAKLERGLVELERVDFSLRELAERSCALLRPGAAAKGLALRLDYAEGLGEFFHGDPLRIQQVLLNLLGNAVKFTYRGEVCLQLEACGEGLSLVVHDTGIGIPADRMERIFEPFAQADASMSRRFGGSGLGTTIARQLVELMGGRIEVHSQLGVGSRFSVFMPLPTAERAALSRVGPELPKLPELHILVVDDVAQNVELLALGLGRQGHRIVTAGDGAEALYALERQRFDVVLMDVQMTRVDGLEACRRWRARERALRLGRTPMIALTASVLDRDREAARAAGMDGFAAKPFELARLLGEIARVTGHDATPGAVVLSAAEPVPAIDWRRGAVLWGSEAALARAIATFCRERSTLVAELRDLQGRELAALLHRMRGLSGNLALGRLAQLLAAFERDCAGGHGLAEEQLQALAATMTELSALLPTQVSDTEPLVTESLRAQPGTARLGAACKRLDRALRRGELDESALAELGVGLGRNAHFAALRTALDNFDFDRALQLLTQLQAVMEPQQEEQFL